MSVSDIREQMLPAKSHEALGSLSSVAISRFMLPTRVVVNVSKR